VRRVLAVALVCACGKQAAEDPRLVVVRRGRLVEITPATGEAFEVAPELAGTAITARAVDAGRAVVVAVQDVETELWRVEVSPYTATRVWHGKAPAVIDGASGDGGVVAIGFGKLVDHGELVDLKPPKASQTWSGDVSSDGRRVLISFATKCDGRGPVGCLYEIWGYDRDAPDRGWRPIVVRATSAYNPRFVPGRDELWFHAAEPDPKRPGEPWGTRVEDTFVVPFAGGEPVLVRARTWTPRFSSDGWVALANSWDRQLLVGERGGELTSIARDARFAQSWSPGGDWLAYQRDDLELVVIRRDGKDGRGVGDGRDGGWIAAALPAGRAAPPTPTAADRERSELAELARVRRDEPLAVFGSIPSELVPGARETVANVAELQRFFAADRRVLAIVPTNRLCELRDLMVVAAGTSFAVATNRLGPGEPDASPVRAMFPASPPEPHRRVEATFANAVSLVGVDAPDEVRAGERFAMALDYQVIAQPSAWKTLVHIDAGMRVNADHLAAPCSPESWRAGERVVDRFEVTAPRTPGRYDVWVGFFSGSAPSFTNARVTSGPHDASDRVLVTTIVVK
jgi:hypothetical protein